MTFPEGRSEATRDMNQHNREEEPVTVTDKRRIDPQTGEVREGVPSGAAPQGAAPEAPSAAGQDADKIAELTADLQRVQADFANYRKRPARPGGGRRSRQGNRGQSTAPGYRRSGTGTQPR